MKCPKCGKESEGAKFCPECGFPLGNTQPVTPIAKKQPSKKKRIGHVVLWIFISIWTLGGGIAAIDSWINDDYALLGSIYFSYQIFTTLLALLPLLLYFIIKLVSRSEKRRKQRFSQLVSTPPLQAEPVNLSSPDNFKPVEQSIKEQAGWKKQKFEVTADISSINKGHLELDSINQFKLQKSIDKDYEMKMPLDILLLAKMAFQLGIAPVELMHYARQFNFTNTRYIKGNTDLFLRNLDKVVKARFPDGLIPVSPQDDKINIQEYPVFANMSLIREIGIPCFGDNSRLKAIGNDLLQQAHDATKSQLADMRKKNRESDVK